MSSPNENYLNNSWTVAKDGILSVKGRLKGDTKKTVRPLGYVENIEKKKLDGKPVWEFTISNGEQFAMKPNKYKATGGKWAKLARAGTTKRNNIDRNTHTHMHSLSFVLETPVCGSLCSYCTVIVITRLTDTCYLC